MIRNCLIISACVLSSFSFGNNEWVKIKKFEGGERERTVSFSIGGRGYVGMGQDSISAMRRDLWEYDPGVNSWTQKANCTGIARRNASAFVIGTTAYVCCGVDNAISWMGNVLNDMWAYSPITNTWTARAACPIQNWGVYYGVSFSLNGYGYICTGKYAPSTYSVQNWRYDPVGNFWQQMAPFPGGVRYGACGFVIGGDAYMGTGADENAFTDDFWKYNGATNTWTAIADFPASARFTCSAFSINGLGYVALGTDGGFKDELFEYDPVQNSWQQRKNFSGDPRRNAAAFVIGYKAYVGTGNSATTNGVRRDFYQYTPWAPLSTGNGVNGDFPSKIFPNPVVDVATLEFEVPEGEELFSISIYDISGKKMREEFTGPVQSYTLERGNLAAGNYFAKLITSGGFSSSVKFIVK